MEELAPIVLFVYNRPELTKKTISYLKQNFLARHSDIFIFSDGPKNDADSLKVREVRNIVQNIKGFRTVKLYSSVTNKGLANSVISGVTQVINKYGKVIVLEDDIIASKYFLSYMNEALNYFESIDNVWSISAYSPNLKFPDNYQYDLYKVPRGCSWGWATWKSRWDLIDWDINDYKDFIKNRKLVKKFNEPGNELTPMLKDQIKGRIDSWAIRWYYNQFKYGSFTIFPKKSFVINDGFKGDGTHGSISNRYITDKVETYDLKLSDIPLDSAIIKEFSRYFNLTLINYIGFLLKNLGLYKPVKRFYKFLYKEFYHIRFRKKN